MRTWRVGSFSMGGALVFLGVFLLLQQLFNWDPAIALLSWWPVLFIILGIEILIYLSRTKDEKSNVKYDFISIIFISIIGSLGLGVALLQSVGLLDVTSQFVSAEIREVDLPTYHNEKLERVERIQIEPGPYEVTVEATPSKELSMFGTYTGEVVDQKLPIKNVSDYALIEQNGDTLFIKLKKMPINRFNHSNGDMETVILIPQGMKLDVNGKGSGMIVKPRDLQNDWNFSDLGSIKLDVSQESNIKVDVYNSNELNETDWKEVVKDKEDEIQSASTSFGTGKQRIIIKNTYEVGVR